MHVDRFGHPMLPNLNDGAGVIGRGAPLEGRLDGRHAHGGEEASFLLFFPPKFDYIYPIAFTFVIFLFCCVELYMTI